MICAISINRRSSGAVPSGDPPGAPDIAPAVPAILRVEKRSCGARAARPVDRHVADIVGFASICYGSSRLSPCRGIASQCRCM